ncbi:bifunctional diaminohydroxyphosphoribosylaminopyrimidine deaminase/5-amino-6-(5-phosphoribosylamino)uracil reductase RibD [Patescibacteria group bacterium]|nr:bifunctional diaminohydroxyphosphoribosylaminopyrimidine deaminase/5-amino-6-(5-phosphoribosylamino)uracil reductase RibD [Patescibacteria group bacterium]
MKEAIELARNGYGKTRTNPLVGAILYKDGKKIGEGWHNKFGVEHAEVNAIRSVRNVRDLKGARMIVTLEPCSHFGKTPPCVDAIVQAGIAEVFVGMKDPFSRVAGRGIKALRDAGIKVELLSRKDALYPDLLALNQPFLKVAKYGLPYVCMKAGMSLDGKIASSAGMSKWITSNESRVHAKKLREKFDAVVVGVNTVNVDDPSLLAKGALRVVLDGTLQISKSPKF